MAMEKEDCQEGCSKGKCTAMADGLRRNGRGLENKENRRDLNDYCVGRKESGGDIL